jgi:hypothetical protein
MVLCAGSMTHKFLVSEHWIAMLATEAERFWSHVVKGPMPTDCWIWTGAITDDGCSRFWIKDDTSTTTTRRHRFC